MLIVISDEGYIRKLSLEQFSTQKRGGKGVIAFSGEERLKSALQVVDDAELLVFTAEGKVYPLELKDVPLSTRQAKGTHLKNFISALEGRLPLSFHIQPRVSSFDN